MSWMLLAAEDLQNALTQVELDVFSQSVLEPDQDDRVKSLVVWVTALVRGKVAAYPVNRNRMDQNGDTIPEELYGAAIEICRYKLLTSFPQGGVFLDASRTASYRDALKQLDDCASGKFVVGDPDTLEFDQNAMQSGYQYDSSNMRQNQPNSVVPPPGSTYPCMPFDFSH
jgi:hypothetical protein